ncbi:MAG: BrnA antitoxin family protein [Alcaligenaceae bacterium]|nr:BrnA antitoxin family protein [Alcaligenaceae bacterium]
MPANTKGTRTTWLDPDDAPQLNDAFFQKADLYHGEKLIRRGRPKSAAPSVSVSLRIPPDVLDRWKSTGPGWQTRMVAALKSHAPKGGHA